MIAVGIAFVKPDPRALSVMTGPDPVIHGLQPQNDKRVNEGGPNSLSILLSRVDCIVRVPSLVEDGDAGGRSDRGLVLKDRGHLGPAGVAV